MGSIVDTRPALGKPSFLHFFAMPSAEIQKLLVKAYTKQIEALIEHEVRARHHALLLLVAKCSMRDAHMFFCSSH